MSFAEGDEVPLLAWAILSAPFVATEIQWGFIPADNFRKRLSSTPVLACVLGVDLDVLRGAAAASKHQRAQRFHQARAAVHLLPEQVRGVEFHADVGGPVVDERGTTSAEKLNTRFCGCNSSATLTSRSAARALVFFQNGKRDRDLVVQDLEGAALSSRR